MRIQELKFEARAAVKPAAPLSTAEASQKRLLEASREAVDQGAIDAGWRYLQAAGADAVETYSAAQLKDYVHELRSEAKHEIDSTARREAMADLLRRPSRTSVQRAVRLRAADLGDVYHRLREIRGERWKLMLWLLGIYAAFVLMARFGGLPLGPEDIGAGWRMVLAVLLAGALGGSLSALTKILIWKPDLALPSQWLANLTISVRTLVGAGSALATYFVSLSDFLTIAPNSGAQALGVAFIAGVGERVVLWAGKAGSDLYASRKAKKAEDDA